MTIVVGFKCTDGIVLAADTQITNWNSHSYESKILDISAGVCSCYIAYSGDVLLTKEVKQELKETVGQVSDERVLIKTIKAKITELHKEHFTNAIGSDKSALQMLIAARIDEEWNLYIVYGRRFVLVDDYQLLGIGEETGRAIFDPRYKADLTIDEARHLAAYGLRIIKKYVKGCGGDSNIYVFENDWLGETPNQVEDVDNLEENFVRFETAINPLLFSLTPFYNDAEFEQYTKSFLKTIRAIRHKEKKKIARRQKQHLKKLREKGLA